MKPGLVLLAIAAAASPGRAAELAGKPLIGPPPAWVVPAKPPANPSKPDDAAVRLLLSDQQMRLTKEGEDVYTESLVRVQTPQGLQLLGSITFPWKPDTSTLTVHKLRILRGDKAIDLLKDGSGFTVLRRENKLEYATLDGVLTAVIQPEGLQVGDVIDVATTVSARDPVTAGHPEGSLGGWANVPIDHVSSRAIWDAGLPIRWRQTDGTPAVRETHHDGLAEISLSADALPPVLFPKDAPQRFRLPRMVEATSFRSWADLGALFAPLYRKAEAIPPGSPLATEVAKIAAATKDPVARTEAALALVQDQVRYVFLGLADGGLMPAAADLTWQRRFGDCKGKTVLLIAVLRALGIEAEPAIVSTAFGDGLDGRLPMIGLFDHVLVRTVLDGKTFWLDGTRTGDRRLADVAVPGFQWALPLRPAGATLERLVQLPATRPFSVIDVRIDASKGISRPAPFHAETVLRGDVATQLRMSIANLTPEQRERGLDEFWTKKYDFLTVKAANASYDERTGEERLTVDGTAAMDWSSNAYEADGMGVGWTADFSRADGPHSDAPFAVAFPAYERSTETILLPNGGKGFAIDTPDIDRTVAGIAFHRQARLSGGTYTVEMSQRTIAPEFPASEAAADQAALRALAKQRVFLNKTRDYAWTPEERQAIVATDPKTAGGYLDRAAARFQQREWREAIADYSASLKLKPDDATVLTWRGRSSYYIGELAAAEADLRRAVALDARSTQAQLFLAETLLAEARPGDAAPLARQAESSARETAERAEALMVLIVAEHRAGHGDAMASDRTRYAATATPGQRAFLAAELGDDTGTIAAADDALRANPDDVYTRRMRGEAYVRLGRYGDALADGAALIKAKPDNIDSYLFRARVFDLMGDREQAVVTAVAAVTANPRSDYAHVVLGSTYASAGRQAEAMREYERAIAISPKAYIFLTRASNRPARDVAGRDADIAAALTLEPDNADALAMRGQAALKRHDYHAALADADDALRRMPGRPALLDMRALARLALAQADLARADFAAARAAASSPAQLNELCWRKATAGLALDEALADCDAALKIAPTAAGILDSRAFVLFRLGRYADAALAYDAALKVAPRQGASLYMRGLTRLKLGRTADGQADIAAARALSPRVAAQFADYGVTA